jgi:hypothetical protein
MPASTLMRSLIFHSSARNRRCCCPCRGDRRVEDIADGAVARHDGAVGQADVDQAGVRHGRHQVAVAQVPDVVRLVVGVVAADGEVWSLPTSRLTRSSSVNDFSCFSTDHRPACTTCWFRIDRAAVAHRSCCRRPCRGGRGCRLRLARRPGRRAHRQRVVTGEHRDRVQVAVEAVELVRHAPAADLLVVVRRQTRVAFMPRPSARSRSSVLPGAASMVKWRISLLIRVPVSGSKPGKAR